MQRVSAKTFYILYNYKNKQYWEGITSDDGTQLLNGCGDVMFEVSKVPKHYKLALTIEQQKFHQKKVFAEHKEWEWMSVC